MNILVDGATVAHDVLAAYYATSSGDGEGQWLKLIFMLSGPAFYFVMWSRYRNAKARHQHERETEAQITQLTGNDVKIKRITGTSSSSLSGANDRAVRGARN
jgi:hypothetical protein